ncbi:MAG: polymer-forming cytoskeletal protein [Phycisphaerales bacterium]|nr:polymer-forming cytoskeletal protein [Phycisphaerales bacterium]
MIGHVTNRAQSREQSWVLPDFAQQPPVRPTHCCVYCGNPVYAPPRATHVHCPKCYRHISVKDILLTGTVTHERFLTAGKITVAPNAHVTAELVACHIDLAGEVHGTILASQSCSVHPTAKHIGTLLTRYLNIQPGATLHSAIEIIRD